MPERERGTVEGSVVALVVNYKTLELTRQCVQTLLAHYPFLPVVMIDNASADRSTSFIAELASERDNIHAQINEKNMHHGPALDQGMRIAEARYVLTLDSDCEILRAGFIEEMLKQFENPRMYAVGELRYKNRFGYTYGYWYADPRPKWIPYVHPSRCAMHQEHARCPRCSICGQALPRLRLRAASRWRDIDGARIRVPRKPAAESWVLRQQALRPARR
jgi:glycosyltransferase involved in cell wall biosynthesis